jgi:hypothetical protein
MASWSWGWNLGDGYATILHVVALYGIDGP